MFLNDKERHLLPFTTGENFQPSEEIIGQLTAHLLLHLLEYGRQIVGRYVLGRIDTESRHAQTQHLNQIRSLTFTHVILIIFNR